MKDYKGLLIIVVSAVVVFVSVLLFVACSFRPTVWEENLPAECNMTLNTYKLYYSSKDKSATVPGADFCYKKLHRLYCQEEVFGRNAYGGINAVDYNDSVRYRNYSQCMSEIK